MAITIKEVHVRTTIVRTLSKPDAIPPELVRRLRRSILEELRSTERVRIREEKER